MRTTPLTFAKEHLTLLSEVDRTKELFVKREQSADEAELVSLGAILRYRTTRQRGSLFIRSCWGDRPRCRVT